MARKEPSNSAHARGFSDIIGITLIAMALMLLVAQWSFDRFDLRVVHNPPNQPPHNWIGSVGASMAYGTFIVFGAAAYLLPMLFLYFGLGFLWEYLAYLRKRWWAWCAAIMLVVCCMGMLDLFTDKELLMRMGRQANATAVTAGLLDPGFLEHLTLNLAAPSAGGFIGKTLNDQIFLHFGRPGATILFATLYIISLYFLTNFQLGEWLRQFWAEHKTYMDNASDAEKALERRAMELEKQANALQEEIEKSGKSTKASKLDKADKAAPEEKSETAGLGADLQPVPEPIVRDLTISSQPDKAKDKDKSKGRSEKGDDKEDHALEIDPAVEGDVIPAREVAAATTGDILGSKTALSKSSPSKDDELAVDGKTPGASSSEQQAAFPKLRPLPRKHKPISVAATPKIGNYQLPSMDFLSMPDTTVKPTESKEELMANALLMKNTLAQFDIEVSLGDITKGPTITRYELHPAPGVRMEKITGLTNNIAAALKAERIHILAPVPGKSSVGVEVPNLIKTKVIMRDLFESDEWRNTKARLPVALGKDVYGHPIIADLAEMPHLLVAGSTGSGKSVCINSIIASLLYRFPPDQLRFVMIDPKVVELQQYNVLPHLVVPVVTDPKKVILALRWVVTEMEKRYHIFAKVGVRNIKSFNERPRGKPPVPSEPELPLTATKEKVETSSDGFAVKLDDEIVVPRDDDIVVPDKLSYIVVIIDELADLMLVAPAEVEMAIARITQMARAAGIHVIVATQRPSVDVITGVIKANIPSRIAFQVAARVDSRTILDAMGADKLLGKGDMLYLPPGSGRLIRAQGALVTDQEIQSVVDFIAKQGKPSYEVEIHQQLQKTSPSGFDGDNAGGGDDEDENLIEQCIEIIRSEQKASVSLLQRRLRLGYTRAARIMDELENRGIVGPSKGAEPRDILLDLDNGGADGSGETHGR